MTDHQICSADSTSERTGHCPLCWTYSKSDDYCSSFEEAVASTAERPMGCPWFTSEDRANWRARHTSSDGEPSNGKQPLMASRPAPPVPSEAELDAWVDSLPVNSDLWCGWHPVHGYGLHWGVHNSPTLIRLTEQNKRLGWEVRRVRLTGDDAQTVGAKELERVREKMKRLKETECMRSGQMDEALLYGLHGAVERYLAALAAQPPAAPVDNTIGSGAWRDAAIFPQLPNPLAAPVEACIRTFDTTGTTLARIGKVLTITCADDATANRVADQLRTEPHSHSSAVCAHEWRDVDSQSDNAVKCNLCGVPGERQRDGGVYWPAT